MEFGKLGNVDRVEWDLPHDSSLSMDFLQSKQSRSLPLGKKFYIGAPMWGPKEWLGLIYPRGTKPNDYLYHYSRNYNCIELNTTHYRIPTAEQTRQWLRQVPEGFLFCPKVLQSISHDHLNDMQLLKSWWDFLEKLGNNLGPCFLQFHHHFGYQNKALVHELLKKWPKDFPLALEFRHPSWFKDRQILPALTKYLQEKEIGLVITDVAGRRDVLHTTISANYSMLRFIGNDLHPSDRQRAEDWALRLQSWMQLGLEKMFVFVHEPQDMDVLRMTEIMIEVLNKHANAQLEPLHWCQFMDKSEKLLDIDGGIGSI